MGGRVLRRERDGLYDTRRPRALGDRLVHERQDQAAVELPVISDDERGEFEVRRRRRMHDIALK